MVDHGHFANTVPSYFQQPKRYTRQMHPLLYRQIHASFCYHKYSFFAMTIVLYSSLPE